MDGTVNIDDAKCPACRGFGTTIDPVTGHDDPCRGYIDPVTGDDMPCPDREGVPEHG